MKPEDYKRQRGEPDRHGQVIDEVEIEAERAIWGPATKAAQKRMADAAPPPVKGPAPLGSGVLAPKGRYGFPTL